MEDLDPATREVVEEVAVWAVAADMTALEMESLAEFWAEMGPAVDEAVAVVAKKVDDPVASTVCTQKRVEQ